MEKVGKINPMHYRSCLNRLIGILITTVAVSCTPAAQQMTPPAAATATATPTPKEISEVTATPSPGFLRVIPDQVVRGTEILFWHPWSGESANRIERISRKFNDENEWGIQVIVEPHADASVILEDITKASDTGELPDLVAVEPFALKLLSEQGIPVQDLTQFISSGQWGFSELEMNEIPLAFLKADQEGGMQTGFPASRTGYVIFYNQSWAKELSFSQIPTTIEEFRDQACAAAMANLGDSDASNNGTGGLFYQSSPEILYSWMRAFNGDVFENFGEGKGFESDENRLALEYLFDLFRSDCAWVGREITPYRYFAERYALFYSGNMQDISIQASYNQASGSQDEWTVIPYPSPSVEMKPTVLLDGFSYGILGDDPQKTLAAWIFIKYLLEAENQIEQIEQSIGLPINISIMQQMDSFKNEYPAWQQAFQLLPFAEYVPSISEWGIAKRILQDIANQLILFTTETEDIPLILRTADTLMMEMEELP